MQSRNNYTPDVLDCLANLSNDEVFTPPVVVNQMLDMLPQEVFMSKETTFLDPFTKSGVFLREITKRLLENQIPDYKLIAEQIENITKGAIQEAVRFGQLDLDDKDYEDKARRIGDAAIKAHPDANKFLNFEIDLQDALDHILKEQVFGIAITELTAQLARRSLYCSKDASGCYSVAGTAFGVNSDGNIRFEPMSHVWDRQQLQNGTFPKGTSCKYCGASAEQFDRPADLEAHAYEFIHKDVEDIRKEFCDMEFTVVCGNPPYQMNDGGSANGMSAKPIYQLFVQQAKRLNPKYLTMIIPARWFSGGKGLDAFRTEMLTDDSISVLVDYPNSKDCFAGVDIAGGVCYFLRDRDYHGTCKVYNMSSDSENIMERPLNEYEVFIRSNIAIDIVKKINNLGYSKHLDEVVYPRLPFGVPTTYTPVDKGIPCYFTQKMGVCNVADKDITDAFNIKNKWKFLIPKAPIAGQTDFTKPIGFYYEGNTRIASPGEICSESWLVAGAFDSEEEAKNYKSYIFTKVVRFLLLQTVISQNTSRKNFCFIPALDKYDRIYTDEMLCDMWNITDEEYEFIKTKIGEIGSND